MTHPDVDVLVIGAGIHGVGVAQAAAARGHSVLVVEQGQVASGTSSRSSKLIHGGLRYLETLQLSLVRESLRERQILLRIAPHLVQLIPFFIPVYQETRRRPWQLRAGLSLYSALLGFQKDSRFQRWPHSLWSELAGLRQDGLQAVFRYHDGQTNDAELTRTVLMSATDLGARSKCETELVHGELLEDGVRAVLRTGAGTEETVKATTLVNATGPWVNEVAQRIGPVCPHLDVELVAGTHVVLDSPTQPGAYYTEAPQDGRAVFVIPWQGRTLVGTTERVHRESPSTVAPTPAEVEYLRTVFCHAFPERSFDPVQTFAGLRVLPKGDGDAFGRRRDVTLVTDRDQRPRVLSLYGGKLTGYRHTAERVLERLTESLPPPRSMIDTAQLPLPQLEAPQAAATSPQSRRPEPSQPPGV